MIKIDQEHSDYKKHAFAWRLYRDLYAGGSAFKSRASQYLLRRQKEPLDVFSERLERVFYENYIGSIIDWYGSTLFHREPEITFEGQAGQLGMGKPFFSEFIDDCDQRGTKLSDFFRRCLIEALVVGEGHILIDFPKASSAPRNRAEEDLTGLSRAFLLRYDAEEVINWNHDARGDYEWVVIRTRTEQQPSVNFPEIVKETRWTYYDKAEFRLYRQTQQADAGGPIELVASGPHALASQGRVPLFSLKVPEGLWLMNKAAHLQLEHFNKSNALGWAITMGLFAVPIIYSDREWNQIVGESYYIQLAPGDKFGWTEPDGKVYQIAASNLDQLKEEMYRVCYMSQASGEGTTGHAQSAASKQIDSQITNEMLRAYGATVKQCMKNILTAISTARQDGVLVSVSGLDEFDINDFGTELDQAAKLLQLGIASPTLKRQIYQRLASKYLSDARQDTKNQIAREIEEQVT